MNFTDGEFSGEGFSGAQAVAGQKDGANAQRVKLFQHGGNVRTHLVFKGDQSFGAVSAADKKNGFATLFQLIGFSEQSGADINILFFQPTALSHSDGGAVDQSFHTGAGNLVGCGQSLKAGADFNGVIGDSLRQRMIGLGFGGRGQADKGTVGQPFPRDVGDLRFSPRDEPGFSEDDGAYLGGRFHGFSVTNNKTASSCLAHSAGEDERFGQA